MNKLVILESDKWFEENKLSVVMEGDCWGDSFFVVWMLRKS